MKLGNLDVTLKGVKTFQGHEGIGLNAMVYVNGVKTLFFLDDANGGGGWPNGIFDKGMYKLLEEEIEKQPMSPYELGDYKGEMKFDLETLVNDICEELDRAKFVKKRTKLCETAIVWGNPNANNYSYLPFKIELARVPKTYIEKVLKEQVQLKEGEIIFNTNIDVEMPVPQHS